MMRDVIALCWRGRQQPSKWYRWTILSKTNEADYHSSRPSARMDKWSVWSVYMERMLGQCTRRDRN